MAALDWTQRPDNVKAAVDATFAKLSCKTRSTWTWYNGREAYHLCSFDEHLYISTLVRQNYPQQKEFHIVDIGCGDASWSRGVVKHISSQTAFPQDVAIYIFNLRGEGFPDESPQIEGVCRIHNLGRMRIEELSAQLQMRNLRLEGKVDLLVSRRALYHLVDPVATLLQAINLLRPGSGIALFDSFYFVTDEEPPIWKSNSDYWNERLVRLLKDIGEPFLVEGASEDEMLHDFLLQRSSNDPIQVRMSYHQMLERRESWPTFSKIVCSFKRHVRSGAKPSRPQIQARAHRGDKRLYELLAKMGVLTRTSPQRAEPPPQSEDSFLSRWVEILDHVVKEFGEHW